MAGDQEKFQKAMAYAKRFAEQENWAEAIRAYRFALAEFPNDLNAILGFGRANLAAGQLKLAQKAFNQALKLDPSNLPALTHVAEIYEQQGQLHTAAECFLRVGNILISEEDFESAIEVWQRVIRLDPHHVDAHRQLAQGLAWQEKPRLAARQLLTLAAIYQERDNPDQAMQQILEAQELIGNDPGLAAAKEALRQGTPIDPNQIAETPPAGLEEEEPELGFADYVSTYTDDEAIEEDLFAVAAEPEAEQKGGLVEAAQKDALAELANVIFEENNEPPAQAGMSTDEVNMLIIQAIDLQSRDNLAEAAENFRRVVAAGMASPALYFNLGLLSKELGQYDEAIKMLQASVQAEPYTIPAHFALGRAFYAVRNYRQAIQHFVEAVKLIDLQTVDSYKGQELLQHYDSLPNTFLAQEDIGKINSFITALENFFSQPAWKKRVYEARQRMDSVSENGAMSLAEFLETPETEVVITTLAVTNEYIRRNLLLTASETCLRAIQKAPTYLPLHIRLADILLRQDHIEAAITKYLYITKVYQIRNQPEKAIGVYHKILDLAPMDVTVRSRLIDLYIATGGIEQAVEQYLTLANSYYQLAQVDRALEKYNEALRLTDDLTNGSYWKAQILNNMGDIYNQRFDWARATTAFEQLIRINPNDERTLRQLVDLYFKQRKTDQALKTLDNLLAAYRQQDRMDSALELLRELASSYPKDMALRQRLAEAYINNGNKAAAIAEYDALGEMQLENGLRDQAARTIQAILDLGPEDPAGYRKLLAQIGGGAG